jgi:hypothetical protein
MFLRTKPLNALKIPAALLLLSLISYAPLIPWLGFYWDDWPTIWFFHSLGADGFREVFAVDRPLLSWMFMLSTPIMGESTIAWQIFGLFTRWLGGLTLWWMLRTLFPRWKMLAAWAAMLFVIYPGFRQQYISVTYSHGFIYMSLFFLSLGLMILAVREPSRFWYLMIISIFLSTIILFTVEYYFGLELMRPVILWLVLAEKASSYRERIKRVLLYWSPYLLLLLAFVMWTLFLHETPRGDIQIFNELSANPAQAVFNFIRTIFQDAIEASLIAWTKTLNLFNLSSLTPLDFLLYSAIVLGTTVLAFLFLTKLQEGDRDNEISNEKVNNSGAITYIAFGALAILTGGWPFWVTDLELKLRFPLDRFTLPLMFAACILAAGVVKQLFKARSQQALIVGLLVGFAAGFHYMDAVTYRQEWQAQKDFFWQLTWRAPGIKPYTTLLTPELPFEYYSDNSLTAPLNWTYDPHNTSNYLSYLMLDLEARLGNALTHFGANIPINHPYRAMSFSGNMSQMLVFFYEPPRCVTIFDPGSGTILPDSPRFIPEALALSNPGLIITDADPPAAPPTHIFGPEPEHEWCYYFQKAELARQKGDWNEVARLGDQVFMYFDNLRPESAVELIPFIEGYAHVGRWQETIQLFTTASQMSAETIPFLCTTWDRIDNSISPTMLDTAASDQISDILQCIDK